LCFIVVKLFKLARNTLFLKFENGNEFFLHLVDDQNGNDCLYWIINSYKVL